MAATSTLLKLTPLQWNPPTSSPYMQQRHHPPSVYFYSKPQLRSNFAGLQIAVKYKQSIFLDTYVSSDTNRAQIWKNSSEKILIQIKKTLDSLKKPAIATVLLGLLLFYGHNCGLAASSGRIGGSSFSSRSSKSSSSSSFSSSSSSSRGSSSSSRSRDSSSSSRSRGSSSSSTSSGSAPSYSYSARSSTHSARSSTYSAPSFGLEFEDIFTIIILFVTFICVSEFLLNWSTNRQTTGVLKLQVGLLGSARTLQQDFNRLAETADTSTPEGLSFVLTEATLALLRHPDYWISCCSSVDVTQSIEEGETQFNQLSLEERGKFDEETLVNVDGIKRQSSKIQKANGLSNEYIVVTILVAAEGTLKLETIKGIADLKEALQKLGSIPSKKIMAVRVLWTPQNEKDVLSEKELLEDYPLLRPF